MRAQIWRALVHSQRTGDLYIGAAAAGLVAYVGLTWNEAQAANAEKEKRALWRDLDKLRRDQERELKERKLNFTEVPALYAAKVGTLVGGNVGFDGPQALPDVALGESVDVLEENCGPEKAYHRCRSTNGEGLYLAAYLVREPQRS